MLQLSTFNGLVGMENWRSVPAFGEYLEVSDLGRVRILPYVATNRRGKPGTQRRPGKVLSPWMAQNGYFHVTISVGGITPKKLLVHRLVASAFVPGELPGLTVNHIDGVKTNNVPTNLEWVTTAENTRLQWETGLVNLRGDRHPNAKLSDDQSRDIMSRPTDSPTALAREFGVSVSLIYKIRQGRKKAWLTL